MVLPALRELLEAEELRVAVVPLEEPELRVAVAPLRVAELPVELLRVAVVPLLRVLELLVEAAELLEVAVLLVEPRRTVDFCPDSETEVVRVLVEPELLTRLRTVVWPASGCLAVEALLEVEVLPEVAALREVDELLVAERAVELVPEVAAERDVVVLLPDVAAERDVVEPLPAVAAERDVVVVLLPVAALRAGVAVEVLVLVPFTVEAVLAGPLEEMLAPLAVDVPADWRFWLVLFTVEASSCSRMSRAFSARPEDCAEGVATRVSLRTLKARSGCWLP